MWFQRYKPSDFDVNQPRQPKKFKDKALQALLDKDLAQTQEQLAILLKVTQKVVFLRLQALVKIRKEGIWVPYELPERNKE